MPKMRSVNHPFDVDPSSFFANARVPCPRCGQQNDFGSSERLYFADSSVRCVRCGFLLIEHLLRKMEKLREKIDSDPEWRALLRSGRGAEVLRRLDALVPIEPDGASSPTPGNDCVPKSQ
jgi:ribosomal protein S27AE